MLKLTKGGVAKTSRRQFASYYNWIVPNVDEDAAETSSLISREGSLWKMG